MKVCAEPGCTELTESSRCPDHAKKPWAGRNGTEARKARGSKLTGWQEQKRNQRILKHNPRCYQCGAKATQVDHLIPTWERPDLENDANNLKPICELCHLRKSKAEAARARRMNRDG